MKYYAGIQGLFHKPSGSLLTNQDSKESNKVFFRGSIGSKLKNMGGFWTLGKKYWTGFGKHPVNPSSKTASLSFRGSHNTFHTLCGDKTASIARNAFLNVCRSQLIFPRCVCFFFGGAVLDSSISDLDEFVTEFPLFYSEINNLGGCNSINHSSVRAHVLP